MLLELLLIAAPLLIAWAAVKYFQFVARYPRGPTPLPFIGNLNEVNLKSLWTSLDRYGEQHKGVFTVFTPMPYVNINTYEQLREAFIDKGDDFANRPQGLLFEAFQYAANSGVVNSNGDVWREQRRAALSILRDFGMGKNIMEERVRSSVQEFLDHLERRDDLAALDPRWPIQLMVANVINETLFGFRYKYDDCAELVNYVENFGKFLETMVNTPSIFLAVACPPIVHVPWIGWHVMGKHKANLDRLTAFVDGHVDRILDAYDVEAEPECFVQAYKQRMAGNEHLTRLQLGATCQDFFSAGQGTTSATLGWAVLLLAAHQDVQDKLRQEIHAVVGRDELPRMADKLKMPYAQACVLELQRRANILPMNVIHVTTRDTEAGGQKIPAGTFVNGDIHFIMSHDPLFVDAEAFSPERYLMEDGVTLNKDLIAHTIPFSIGKRQCAGEALARMELFLGLTAIVQHYRILPLAGEVIDLVPMPGSLGIRFRPQKVRFERV